jgi:hypothetical protein
VFKLIEFVIVSIKTIANIAVLLSSYLRFFSLIRAALTSTLKETIITLSLLKFFTNVRF